MFIRIKRRLVLTFRLLSVRQAIGESTNSRREGAEEPREPTPLTESTRATPALDEGDVVVITVAWKPHPQDGNGQEMQWQYMIKRVSGFSKDSASTNPDKKSCCVE